MLVSADEVLGELMHLLVHVIGHHDLHVLLVLRAERA